MNELIMFFLAQSLILVMVIVGAHISLKVSLARLEVRFDGLAADHENAKDERHKLSDKVNGISRDLASVSGELKGCPHLFNGNGNRETP